MASSSTSSVGGEIDGAVFDEITNRMADILFKENRDKGLVILKKILTKGIDYEEREEREETEDGYDFYDGGYESDHRENRHNTFMPPGKRLKTPRMLLARRLWWISLLPRVDYDPENNQISQGSYGKIYEIPITLPTGESVVIGKMMKPSDDYRIQIGFLEENITHLLLYLLYEKNRDGDYSHNVFPRIYGMYRTDETNRPESVLVLMEKAPYDFRSVFIGKNVIDQITQIMIIALFLSELQDKYGFVHGDMHDGNIMFTGNMSDIGIVGHLPYIIDLGMACVDLKNNRNIRVTATSDSYDHCTNKSYDMRMFIASILRFTSEPLRTFFSERFKEYNERFKEYNEKLDEMMYNKEHRFKDETSGNYFHNFYKQKLNDFFRFDRDRYGVLFSPDTYDDVLFRPDTLIKDLSELRDSLDKNEF